MTQPCPVLVCVGLGLELTRAASFLARAQGRGGGAVFGDLTLQSPIVRRRTWLQLARPDGLAAHRLG